MNNEDRFKSVLSTILLVEEAEILESTSSESLDTWDSLNHISLLGALEQEFGVTINTDHIENTRSVAALRTLLSENGVSF